MENRKKIKFKILKTELLKLINPHLENYYNFSNNEYEIITHSPDFLFFNINRFDVIIKYIYAYYQEKKFKTDWHRHIYKEHIAVFSNNTFKEGDGRKNSLFDYYKEFDILISKIKQEGFNPKISILPIDETGMIIDGAHRLAISYLYNSQISTVELKKPFSFGYDFFLQKGLSTNIADFTAFTYCKLNKEAKIVNIFPISKLEDTTLEAILSKYGNIYYKKNIYLTEKAQDYIIKEMYLTEHWIGDKSNNFVGAVKRARIGFARKNNLLVYVYVPFSEKDAIKAKTEIREKVNKGNFPIHINDTHKETIRLAQTYFNENTINFINNRKLLEYNKFNQLFLKYKKWIEKNNLCKDDFCVDASSVLSVYGLREGRDLDFLYQKKEINTNIELVDCHNEHVHYYNTSVDDIIYNPTNHFYFEGYKFVSISLLRKMKENRNEEKDKDDVLLIDSLKTSKISYEIQSLKRKLNKIKPINIYKTIRLNIHKVVPVNSKMWKFLKKLKRN